MNSVTPTPDQLLAIIESGDDCTLRDVALIESARIQDPNVKLVASNLLASFRHLKEIAREQNKKIEDFTPDELLADFLKRSSG